MKLSSWPEIGSDGDVLLMPYVPKGITVYDDDVTYPEPLGPPRPVAEDLYLSLYLKHFPIKMDI